MVTPKDDALKSSSFMIKPECCSSVLHKIPNDRVLWMSACPMSRIVASYLARISVTEAVSPGRSSPVTRIRISSVLNGFISCLLIG